VVVLVVEEVAEEEVGATTAIAEEAFRGGS
jgi:hypothetical protein